MSKSKQKRLQAAAALALEAPLSMATRWIAWLCLGWAAWAIWSYWDHFSWLPQEFHATPVKDSPILWSTFAHDAAALFLMITLLAGAAALGSYLWRLFKAPRHSVLEEAVFSVGLGLGALGYLLLALGLLQLFRPWMFWALWGLGLILAWRRWGRAPRAAFEAVRRPFDEWHRSQRSSWLLLIVLWGSILGAAVMCFVPEIFYDAMVYHLGVPRWYLFEGGIRYYPAIHAQFPFLRQMLNVMGLGLADYRLAKLLQWTSAPLILGVYLVLAARYSRPKAALIAGLAFFSMPMVQMNLWTSGVDVGLAAYTLLAFLAWLNGLTEPAHRRNWMVLAAVFGGFAFASKYPGLLSVAMMSVTTVFWLGLTEKNWRGGILWGAVVSFGALLVASPWLLKTWVFTGNPVYPYLYHYFGGRDLLMDRLFDFTSDTGSGAKSNLLDLLKTPWTETLREVSSLTAPGIFILAFLGFMLAGVLRKELREKWYWAGFMFFVLYWFTINAMTDRLRMAVPGLAVGCFLLGAMASTLHHRGKGFYRFLLTSVVLASALLGLRSTWPTIQVSYDPWNILSGHESETDYLSYSHSGMDPHPTAPMMVYARSVVPPGHRLLIVGDEKVSLAQTPFLASGVHNDSPVVQWSRDAKSDEDLVRRFEKERVSHVLLNVTEGMRLAGYKILNWDATSLGRFSSFFDHHLRLIKAQDSPEHYFGGRINLALYEFVREPLPGPPSENLFLDLFEEQHAPVKDPLMAQKRRLISESLERAAPGLPSLHQRLLYWRSQEHLSNASRR